MPTTLQRHEMMGTKDIFMNSPRLAHQELLCSPALTVLQTMVVATITIANAYNGLNTHAWTGWVWFAVSIGIILVWGYTVCCAFKELLFIAHLDSLGDLLPVPDACLVRIQRGVLYISCADSFFIIAEMIISYFDLRYSGYPPYLFSLSHYHRDT